MADDSETSVKIYLREIMQTPLLTVQQEIELAARIKKGDQKSSGLDDLSKPPACR
jgi:RNA polymerase primary sigma factor